MQVNQLNQSSLSKLKVEDALAYLDRVKQQFQLQPQVYNDFLDIMKEFKSQTIDTPGVIARVSCLFHGHNHLIVGFNAFLPHGYKIELNPDTDTISIYQPSTNNNQIPVGMSLSTFGSLHQIKNKHLPPPPSPHPPHPPILPHPSYSLPAPPPPPPPPPSSAYPPQHFHQQQQPYHHYQSPQPQQQHYNQPPPSSFSHKDNNHHQQNQHPQHNETNPSQPVEFNHAISYVNKIKNRYQNKPEVYKSFLEILHKYQKEQKLSSSLSGNKVMESHVYKNVAILFKDQLDLLHEFSQFLPDAGNPGGNLGGFGGGGSSGNSGGGFGGNMAVTDRVNNNNNNINNNNNDSVSGGVSAGYNNNNKDTLLHLGITASSFKAENNPTTITSTPSIHPIPQTTISTLSPPLNSSTTHPSTHPSTHSSTHPSTHPSSHPPIPAHRKKRISSSTSNNNNLSGPPLRRQKTNDNMNNYNIQTTSSTTTTSATKFADMVDYAFFDKVRSCIGDRMYSNLLKCIWLYNERMISAPELLEMLKSFILKMPELGKRVKQLLETKEDSSVVPNNNNQLPAARIDYKSCKRYDVSYLALSSDFVQPKCSGRTALCHEVLNDKYVSFQSWSEDSSSVIRKTNAEEMVFRCEEERYQLDITLENLQSTLDLLRLAAAKMSSMSPQMRSSFKLDACLGGRGEALPKKTIYGLYGSAGASMMEALREKPSEAVEVVMKRLEGKVDEWVAAREKNNKTWNEQNQKFYLKSLDHAGINFKQVDAKNQRSKTLIQEIEHQYERNREGPHITLNLHKGSNIIEDACSLIVHHLRRQANVQSDEKQRMKGCIRTFMHQFLHMSLIPAISDDDKDIQYGNVDNENKENNNNNNKTIILTQSWYVFLRLFHLLFQRLQGFKAQADEMMKDVNNDEDENSAAVMLGLRAKATTTENAYDHLINLIKCMLDGGMDATTYEEQLREVFSTNAYVAYTADKLVQATVRQLQNITTEDTSTSLVDLFKEGLPLDEHTRRAELLLAGEQGFKMTYDKNNGLLDVYLITNHHSSHEEEKYNNNSNKNSSNNNNNKGWMTKIDDLASKDNNNSYSSDISMNNNNIITHSTPNNNNRNVFKHNNNNKRNNNNGNDNNNDGMMTMTMTVWKNKRKRKTSYGDDDDDLHYSPLFLKRNVKRTSSKRKPYSGGSGGSGSFSDNGGSSGVVLVDGGGGVVKMGGYRMRFLSSHKDIFFKFKGNKNVVLRRKTFDFKDFFKK